MLQAPRLCFYLLPLMLCQLLRREAAHYNPFCFALYPLNVSGYMRVLYPLRQSNSLANYLELRLCRLRQQAAWSDKISTVTICSHRCFFQLFSLKLADYHGVSLTLGLLQRDFALHRLSVLTPDRNGSDPFLCVYCMCARGFTFYCYLSTLVLYVLVGIYILSIPAPSSGYMWRLNPLSCVIK